MLINHFSNGAHCQLVDLIELHFGFSCLESEHKGWAGFSWGIEVLEGCWIFC